MKILISDPLSEIGLTLLKDFGFECIYLPKSDNAESKFLFPPPFSGANW